MKTVKITHSRHFYIAGQVHELADGEANLLIQRGFAEEIRDEHLQNEEGKASSIAAGAPITAAVTVATKTSAPAEAALATSNTKNEINADTKSTKTEKAPQ